MKMHDLTRDEIYIYTALKFDLAELIHASGPCSPPSLPSHVPKYIITIDWCDDGGSLPKREHSVQRRATACELSAGSHAGAWLMPESSCSREAIAPLAPAVDSWMGVWSAACSAEDSESGQSLSFCLGYRLQHTPRSRLSGVLAPRANSRLSLSLSYPESERTRQFILRLHLALPILTLIKESRMWNKVKLLLLLFIMRPISCVATLYDGIFHHQKEVREKERERMVSLLFGPFRVGNPN